MGRFSQVLTLLAPVPPCSFAVLNFLPRCRFRDAIACGESGDGVGCPTALGKSNHRHGFGIPLSQEGFKAPVTKWLVELLPTHPDYAKLCLSTRCTANRSPSNTKFLVFALQNAVSRSQKSLPRPCRALLWVDASPSVTLIARLTKAVYIALRTLIGVRSAQAENIPTVQCRGKRSDRCGGRCGGRRHHRYFYSVVGESEAAPTPSIIDRQPWLVGQAIGSVLCERYFFFAHRFYRSGCGRNRGSAGGGRRGWRRRGRDRGSSGGAKHYLKSGRQQRQRWQW